MSNICLVSGDEYCCFLVCIWISKNCKGTNKTTPTSASSREYYCVTLTLVSHCLTAVKLSWELISYITITPSALRKNCLVMLRYLQEEQRERRVKSVVPKMYFSCRNKVTMTFKTNNATAEFLHLIFCFVLKHLIFCFVSVLKLTAPALLYPTSAAPPCCCPPLSFLHCNLYLCAKMFKRHVNASNNF